MRLEPLVPRHAEDLFAAGSDEAIWTYMPRPVLKRVEDTLGWIEEARSAAATGTQIPFAIILRARGQAIGSTRYLDIRRETP